jgi:hypothetical protein
MVIKILSAISGNVAVVIKQFFSTFSVKYILLFVVRSDSWFDIIEG